MESHPIEKDWIFVSDAHFTGRNTKEADSFIRFLDLEKGRMGHLMIMGDLFEFFFGFKDLSFNKHLSSKGQLFAFPEYLPVLEELQRLYRQGIRIKYIEGNHDFFLHPLFPEYLDMEVEVYPDGCEERLGNKKAFIAHGDLSNPKQWKYRIYRRILKNRLTYGLLHFAGPKISRRIAKRLNDLSYQRYHRGVPSTPPPAFRAFAHKKFLEGFDIVILGHSHFPEEVEERINGRTCLYFNVGDWMSHRSFLRFTPPEHFELGQFKEG